MLSGETCMIDEKEQSGYVDDAFTREERFVARSNGN